MGGHQEHQLDHKDHPEELVHVDHQDLPDQMDHQDHWEPLHHHHLHHHPHHHHVQPSASPNVSQPVHHPAVLKRSIKENDNWKYLCLVLLLHYFGASSSFLNVKKRSSRTIYTQPIIFILIPFYNIDQE